MPDVPLGDLSEDKMMREIDRSVQEQEKEMKEAEKEGKRLVHQGKVQAEGPLIKKSAIELEKSKQREKEQANKLKNQSGYSLGRK